MERHKRSLGQSNEQEAFEIEAKHPVAVENSAGSNLTKVPDSGIIYQPSQLLNQAENVLNEQVVTPQELVRRARATGKIDLLTPRQIEAINLLHSRIAPPLGLAEAGRQMGGITKESVRKLKRKAYRKLKEAMGIKLPLSADKTQLMREIESRFKKPIEIILKECVKEGLGYRRIGARLGIDHHVAIAWMDNFDIEPVSKKTPRKTTKMIDIEKKFRRPIRDVLEKLYKTKSPVEIARVLGLNQSTVRNWLKKFNIKTRTQKKASRLSHADPKIKARIRRGLKRYHRNRRADELRASRLVKKGAS